MRILARLCQTSCARSRFAVMIVFFFNINFATMNWRGAVPENGGELRRQGAV